MGGAGFDLGRSWRIARRRVILAADMGFYIFGDYNIHSLFFPCFHLFYAHVFLQICCSKRFLLCTDQIFSLLVLLHVNSIYTKSSNFLNNLHSLQSHMGGGKDAARKI